MSDSTQKICLYIDVGEADRTRNTVTGLLRTAQEQLSGAVDANIGDSIAITCDVCKDSEFFASFADVPLINVPCRCENGYLLKYNTSIKGV